MKRLLLGILVACLGSLILQHGSSAQQTSETPSTSPLSIRATTVAELRAWDAFLNEGSRSGNLRLRSQVRDPLLPSRVVERFDQFHNGVRIWSADVVRDSDRGVPLSIFGELSPPLTLSTKPGLSVEEARATLLRLGGADALLLEEPELLIWRSDSGGHRLSYTVLVSGSGDVVRGFVDAQTGEELLRYSEIRRQQVAVGSGRGVLGDMKKVSVDQSAGVYIAVDRLRPPVIRTWDMRGDGLRTASLLSRRLPYLNSDLATDSDNVWTDVSVVDAHAHVGLTYDYYYKRFGRSGLDGRNGPIDIIVNPVLQRDAAFWISQGLGEFVNNAGLYPGGGPSGQSVMMFGSGILPGATFQNGTNWTYLSGALDVAAHELTHGVITNTSRLIYANESGALDEAFADMMGKSVEFFYHAPGNGVGQADYVVGKDVIRSLRAGVPHGLRSMANPELYGDPDHYSRYRRMPNTPQTDNGGVHTNSGIPNQAFYLAIEGGTNRTSGQVVQGVGATNRLQIEQVFYRALTTLTPSSANFSMARITSIQAARDLHGSGSNVERAVTQAWDAVGVTNTSSFAPVVNRMPTFTGSVPGGNSRVLYTYAVTMPATGRYQAVLNWTNSAVDLDLMIGPPGCLSYSCMLTRAESATRRPETVCLNVRAGEQYWVMFQNFSAGSTSYDLAQTISPSPTGPCGLPAPTAAPTLEIDSKKGGEHDVLQLRPLN